MSRQRDRYSQNRNRSPQGKGFFAKQLKKGVTYGARGTRTEELAMESAEHREEIEVIATEAETPRFATEESTGRDAIGEEGRIISLPEAARMLGTSYPTVHRLVNAGELKAFRIRNSWRTSTAACEEFVRRRFEEQAKICQSVEVD
jgi:excisionase family DNA binding protein